jgi:hypothetical protein
MIWVEKEIYREGRRKRQKMRREKKETGGVW